MKRYFVDGNLVVALLDEVHSHAIRAKEWANSLSDDDEVLVCRVVEMTALRLLTSRAVMGESVLSAGAAWDLLRAMYVDDRFSFGEEPPGLTRAWEVICRGASKPMRADTDFYLAAFAISGNLTLVSFDNGMNRFNGLSLTLL